MSLIIKYDGKSPANVFEELLIQDRFPETLDVLWAVDFWLTKRNPYFMDYVVCICDTAQIDIGPLLYAEIVSAASLRLQGDKKGTLKGVQREFDTFDQLTQMVSLIYRGMERVDAIAEVVDQLELSEDKAEKRMSTLDSYYTKRIKNTGIERSLHDFLKENEHDSNPLP